MEKEKKKEKDNPVVVKPKMRIQLLDEDLRTLNDRLVDQTMEFTQGPKEKHTKPIKLEVILTSQNDITGLKTYLDALAGSLPLKEVGTRGRPQGQTKELESPREDIMLQVENMIKAEETQDKVIKYLRDLGFVFLLTEDVIYYDASMANKFKGKHIGASNRNGQYPDAKYQWMLRRIKTAKMPISDKYDPLIIFGFDLMKGESSRIVCYLIRDFQWAKKAKVTDKRTQTFANFEMVKYPAFLIEEERLKLSTEIRQLTLDSNKKPTKFFLRFLPDITIPSGIQEKLKHLNLKFKS